MSTYHLVSGDTIKINGPGVTMRHVMPGDVDAEIEYEQLTSSMMLRIDVPFAVTENAKPVLQTLLKTCMNNGKPHEQLRAMAVLVENILNGRYFND